MIEKMTEKLKNQDKEIERLNNIINELEKFLQKEIEIGDVRYKALMEYVLDELYKLKGGK